MANEAEIEAVREQLATWLQSQLQVQFPTVEVLAAWPSGPALPEFAILVTATGEVADTHFHSPVTISSTPTSGAQGLVTYVYGYAEGIQLELDAWASSKPDRDAFALAIRRAMNQPPQATIAGADTGWPRRSRRGNLSLAVTGLYGAIFTYRFTAVPTVDESSGAAEKNEWRSHFSGAADGPLWDQDTMAIIQRIGVVGQIGPGALGVVAGNQPTAGARIQVGVAVTPTTAAIPSGTSQQLNALAVYNDGTTADVTSTATWTTTDASKATVAAGLAHGVAAGSATLTASSGGFSGTCIATVS